MTSISIRRVEGEALIDAFYTVQIYAYHANLPCPSREEWAKDFAEAQGLTCYALYEDDQPVTVAASSLLTQNVRGKLYPAGGVGGVATLPAARRKGYCRQVMAALLSDVKAEGALFSNLYPFRESFYERFGYVVFPETFTATLSPMALTPLLKRETGGELELRMFGDAYEDYRAFLETMRARTHGMVLFDALNRAHAQQTKLWAALAKFDGQVEGVMIYNLRHEPHTGNIFQAERFYYHTSRARTLLLSWIARHTDQAQSAEIHLLAGERPVTWLADIRAKSVSEGFAPMGRVLDVAGISGMQSGPGAFSARISDPLCPFNDGVWRFETQAGRLEVCRDAQPDCDLTIQGLSALVFGTLDPQDLPLRGWGTPTPALQETLRAMFPRMSPYLHEHF